VDLRSAELAKDGAVIDITAIFGGVEIRIPESWAVETHTTGIFGGADNKCKNKEQREGQRVVINATAIFGGIDIKN
jgi:predicted membrane protein